MDWSTAVHTDLQFLDSWVQLGVQVAEDPGLEEGQQVDQRVAIVLRDEAPEDEVGQRVRLSQVQPHSCLWRKVNLISTGDVTVVVLKTSAPRQGKPAHPPVTCSCGHKYTG